MIYYVILWLLSCKINKISSNYISQYVGNTTEDCDGLLTDFSVAMSNFTYCTIVHAKPVTMCENCADSYFNVTETYKHLKETTVNGTLCINNFINLDRLQIVNSVYKNANDLWNRALCSECVYFANGTHEPTKVKRNFNKMYSIFYDCTQKCSNSTNSTNFCDMCLDDYIKLNKFYFSIGDITKGTRICFDIVDLMNKTQAYWSKTCCHYREKNEFIYIVTTVFMGMIPILFYSLVKVFVDIKRPRLLPQNRFAESMNTPSTSFRR